jgi:hypothetical protein
MVVDVKREEPFILFSALSNRTFSDIAPSLRSSLYNHVSSSWLDESWEKELAPAVAAAMGE